MSSSINSVISMLYKTDVELRSEFFLNCIQKEKYLTEPCTICNIPTNYMCQIGQTTYSICRSLCEKRLLDVLSYQIIYKKPMPIISLWNPTKNYKECEKLINHINKLGYKIALVQIENSTLWKCITSKHWDNTLNTYNIVEDDALMAITKMMITLQDIKDHPEDYYQD